MVILQRNFIMHSCNIYSIYSSVPSPAALQGNVAIRNKAPDILNVTVIAPVCCTLSLFSIETTHLLLVYILGPTGRFI